jgi:hypothetical protein
MSAGGTSATGDEDLNEDVDDNFEINLLEEELAEIKQQKIKKTSKNKHI